MKTAKNIAQHLREVFEGGNWTDVNLRDTLQDVHYKDAVTVTRASHNTISALVYHLCFYNEIVLKRLQGKNPVIGKMNGFDHPPVKNENDWMKLKEMCFQSAHNLMQAMLEFPEQNLLELAVTGQSTNYKTLHGVIEHAHYHLGQIVLLKKLVKNPVYQFATSSSL